MPDIISFFPHEPLFGGKSNNNYEEYKPISEGEFLEKVKNLQKRNPSKTLDLKHHSREKVKWRNGVTKVDKKKPFKGPHIEESLLADLGRLGGLCSLIMDIHAGTGDRDETPTDGDSAHLTGFQGHVHLGVSLANDEVKTMEKHLSEMDAGDIENLDMEKIGVSKEHTNMDFPEKGEMLYQNYVSDQILSSVEFQGLKDSYEEEPGTESNMEDKENIILDVNVVKQDPEQLERKTGINGDPKALQSNGREDHAPSFELWERAHDELNKINEGMPINKKELKNSDHIEQGDINFGYSINEGPLFGYLQKTGDGIPLEQMGVIETLADRIIAFISEDRAELEVHIKQGNLGELLLKVSMQDGNFVGKILTANEHTKEFLKVNLNNLESILKDQGFIFTSLDVDVGNQYNLQDFNQKTQVKFVDKRLRTSTEAHNRDVGKAGFKGMANSKTILNLIDYLV